MRRESAWRDHGGGAMLQYDFVPPAQWSGARVAEEQLAIADAIAGDAEAGDEGWLQLARRLPPALRKALVAELRAGNRLAGIGAAGWPDEGSIVVNLRDRFVTARHVLPPGVRWRQLDDPRYAREEMSLTVGPTAYLIIS